MIEARFVLTQGEFTLDVDLRLPAAGISVLFGPSGCGKTSLLRCLAGLTRPQLGLLRVQGEFWQDEGHWLPAHQRAVGMVFQQPQLFPHLTVQGNLDFGQRRAGRPLPQLDQAVELLGIAPLLSRRIEGLSGGERQRVAIARALAVAPQLLLMDEPLASLDAARKAELLPFLDRLHRELTLPIVYVTHALPELLRLADEVVCLDAGRVRAAGPLGQLQTELAGGWLQDDEAGVVLPCTVAERDAKWQLARLRFDGGELLVRDDGHPLGSAVRARLLARDLSLALAEPQHSSISNVLLGSLEALLPDAHPAQCLARVQVGGARLLARLTRQSAERLALRPGLPVWVQVKAVALLA